MADEIVDAEKFGYEDMADQGRLGQGGLRPAGDRGVDPLAAVGPHRRGPDGRVGQPPARRGQHLHPCRAQGGRSEREEAASAERGGGGRPAAVPARPRRGRSRLLHDRVPRPRLRRQGSVCQQKKIGVQYSSINGNGFGGYGEIVFGTKGTLVLEEEQELSIIKGPASPSSVKVCRRRRADARHPGQRRADGRGQEPAAGRRSAAATPRNWSTGPGASAIPPRRTSPAAVPKVAMGDAIIALTTNMAARSGKRIEFKEEWFDIHSDETPEGVPPASAEDVVQRCRRRLPSPINAQRTVGDWSRSCTTIERDVSCISARKKKRSAKRTSAPPSAAS